MAFASTCACSSSTNAALLRRVAFCSAQPFSNWLAYRRRPHMHSKPPLSWAFFKRSASPPSALFGPYQVDPIDPLTKIAEAEMELSKTRVVEPPSRLKLICLGGPGVGKGSYASLVSMRLSIPHISTGDLIRKEVSKPPSSYCTTGELVLREAVRTAMNQGKLVSDEVILKLLSNRLRYMDRDVGFILDGFPRTIGQAHVLDDAVGGVDLAISFHLDDDILISKCLGRRFCSECGKDYNLSHVDLRVHRFTDKRFIKQKRIFLPARLPPSDCTSKLQVRGDDSNEAAVRERLRLYECESEPLEQHYRSHGKLVDLNVGPGAEYVWPRLMDAISKVEHSGNHMVSYCR